MLLDLKEEQRRKIRSFSVAAGLLSVGAIVVIFLKSLGVTLFNSSSSPVLEGDTASLGKLLFTQYVLPFEVISILLLVAMVGVILLSKKDLK
jgi:NADH-quinone oxidoreductase subunit J